MAEGLSKGGMQFARLIFPEPSLAPTDEFVAVMSSLTAAITDTQVANADRTNSRNTKTMKTVYQLRAIG